MEALTSKEVLRLKEVFIVERCVQVFVVLSSHRGKSSSSVTRFAEAILARV